MGRLTRIPKLHVPVLDPVKPPDDFVLLIDTREQLPLFPPAPCETVTTKLDYGDYSIQGFESRFVIERKMISDFYSYIGKERDRTIVKMKAFKSIIDSNGFVALIIESTEQDLLFSNLFSNLTPSQVYQSLVSFRLRYGIHIYFSPDRADLRRFVIDHAVKFYKIQREN